MAFATLALRKGSRCILTPGECKTRLAGKLGKLGAGPAFANTTRIRRQRGEKEDGDPDAEEEDYDDATKDAYGARRRELRCGEERQNSNAEERDESSNADEEDEGPDAEEQGGRSDSVRMTGVAGKETLYKFSLLHQRLGMQIGVHGLDT
ncbi:hypothetical protein GQ600_20943 [Phytophthora cactorum]|nr:hypothetical protein GQ600_20943 [Phytophthora cactorum]